MVKFQEKVSKLLEAKLTEYQIADELKVDIARVRQVMARIKRRKRGM